MVRILLYAYVNCGVEWKSNRLFLDASSLAERVGLHDAVPLRAFHECFLSRFPIPLCGLILRPTALTRMYVLLRHWDYAHFSLILGLSMAGSEFCSSAIFDSSFFINMLHLQWLSCSPVALKQNRVLFVGNWKGVWNWDLALCLWRTSCIFQERDSYKLYRKHCWVGHKF